MNRTVTFCLLALCLAVGLAATPASLDSVYRLHVAKDWDGAYAMLQRLSSQATTPADKFVYGLEVGDFLLDKKGDLPAAEAAYEKLLADFPRHKQIPDVLYRLALAQELQEKFLEAAKNYEKVATRYSKSTYGTDALDAIERCFRKNYQDRVAYVDSFPLTRIELDDRISRNPAAYEKYEKKQELLDTMIANRLLYTAALGAGLTRDSVFLFNLTEARNRAMFQEWYERNVNAKSEPTEKELKAAYKKDLPVKYTTPEKVHAWQIQVATRPEADSLRKALLADSTLVWDSVARQVSKAPDKEKGGDMGLFARGSQPKPVEDAAFALKVGAIGRPVAVKEGFVILKVTEKKPRSVRAYADVKSQLLADMKQQRVQKLYEQVIADLKKQATLTIDSAAIDSGREVLATVNGITITKQALEMRLNAIPPFYRSQFETPEGRRRILDNLILEKLMVKEAEAQKLWLVNKVVDQILTRRAGLLLDQYRRTMTVDKVVLDSAVTMADYKAGIADFKEPTKVHAREISASSQARAEQLRGWAVSGRLPATISGRAILVRPEGTDIVDAFAPASANADSVLGTVALAGAPALLPGAPMVSAAGKNLLDLSVRTKLAGPYLSKTAFGFGFTDLTRMDKLYQPAMTEVSSLEQLDQMLGKPRPESAAVARPADTARLGYYARLDAVLPAEFVTGLFKLSEKETSKPLPTTEGSFVVKVTKKDTAQKATFQDVAKRFSKAPSRWSGGDMYWLAKDDKAHDAKLVAAAFGLSKNGISPVIKLNDSTYTFVLMEERKEAFTKPFSEVRPKIENKLRRQEEKALYDQLLKDLRARADVQIVMKEADFVVEPESLPELPVSPATPSEPVKQK